MKIRRDGKIDKSYSYYLLIYNVFTWGRKIFLELPNFKNSHIFVSKQFQSDIFYVITRLSCIFVGQQVFETSLVKNSKLEKLGIFGEVSLGSKNQFFLSFFLFLERNLILLLTKIE